jgi:dipeptidyl aminopeptidase/acylaminoacyl peptidase
MTDATAAPPETVVEDETTEQETAEQETAKQLANGAPEAVVEGGPAVAPLPSPTVPPASVEAVAVPLPAAPGPISASPDSATIAFLQPDAGGTVRLWLQPLENGDPAPRALDLPFAPLPELDPTGDPGGDDGPQWSPDGTTLALTGTHPVTGSPALWRVDVATGEASLLTDHPAADRGPRWSPDGQLIAFTSFRDGSDTICVVAAAGGPATQLTDGFQNDRDPAWSRDGSQLAFRRAVAGHPTHHDIWILTLATSELKQVTNVPGRANSKAANRRTPRWAPNRSLIAFVTDEKEWDAIAVVNPENLSGWTLADEPGDKAEVRWSPNGLRILYTRTQGAITHCCAKGTSAAKADLLDPEDGVARSPRWLGDSRAVYLHAAPTNPWRAIVQDAKAESERRELPAAVAWSGPAEGLAVPGSWEVEVGDGAKVAGLLYRPAVPEGEAVDGAGAPVVVALGDGPPVRQSATLDVFQQTLAAAGLAVFVPNLRGTPGSGRAFTNQLAELADQEVEAADLADVAVALGGVEGLAADQIAIVGRGYGGTLALLAAASRPGHYAAVVAVDPIVDWDHELDTAEGSWRAWVLRQFGLPAAHDGRYSLRSPYTFAALLEIPVLLIGTGAASPARAAQLEDFAAVLDELGVGYERAAATSDWPESEVARLALEFLRRRLVDQPVPEPVPEPAAEAVPEAAIS